MSKDKKTLKILNELLEMSRKSNSPAERQGLDQSAAMVIYYQEMAERYKKKKEPPNRG